MDILEDKDLENITIEEAEKMSGEKFAQSYGYDLYDNKKRSKKSKTYKIDIT